MNDTVNLIITLDINKLISDVAKCDDYERYHSYMERAFQIIESDLNIKNNYEIEKLKIENERLKTEIKELKIKNEKLKY